MKLILCLSIAAVFLFGAAVVHGQVTAATLSSIDCSRVHTISFVLDVTNMYDLAQWDFTDPAAISLWAVNGNTGVAACKPTYAAGPPATLTYGPFDVAVCGITPIISFDKVIYQFSITVVSDDTPVTYQYDHLYTVKCSYDKQQNLQASFQPLHSLSDDGSAGGNLLIAFTLHLQSDNSELAGIIDLSTPIYGKVVIEADPAFPDLDVHLQLVQASSDSANSVNQILLIQDGCEKSTVVDHNSVSCDADADERFNMFTNGAFRFSGQVTGNEVYFHATVIVCLASDGMSECQQECAAACAAPTKRKRRETVQDAMETTYYVSAGPYRIADSKKEAAVDKDEGAAFPTYAIAVVAVCGVVVIAIASAVVVIVLRRRRQNSTVADPRNTGVTA
ncbi:hypothetical protein ACROYT_G039677 [Oculina patagonica]